MFVEPHMVDWQENFFNTFTFAENQHFKLPHTTRNDAFQARVDRKQAQFSHWFRRLLDRMGMTYSRLSYAIVYSVRRVNVVDGLQCCVCGESTALLLVADNCYKGHHVHYNCAKFLRERIDCQLCLSAADNLPSLVQRLKVCEEDEEEMGVL